MGDSARWAFRVASRREVGGGHVSRCLTLARALADLGDEIVFVLDDDGAGWERRVSAEGHKWTAVSAPFDAPIEGCLLDGYEFPSDAVQFWRTRAAMMATIADQLPSSYPADLIIAPGIAATAAPALGGRVLAGLEYALVAPSFAAAAVKPVAERAANILVGFGLRDSRNATGLTLSALDLLPEVKDGTISVTVAMGASAPHLSAVRDQVQNMRRAICVTDTDMTRFYAQADLVVGGGGLSLLERMALGIPSISVLLAENQRSQIEQCAVAGGTLAAGRIEDLEPSGLAKAVSLLLHSRERRSAMSRNARKAVDGQGAKRCAQAMWEVLRVH